MLLISRNRIFAILVALFLSLSLAAPALAHGGEEKKEGGEEVKGPMYVDLKSIIIPVIKKNGRTGMVVLALMAEVPTQDAHTTVTHQMPKLRDAFIRALYGNMESQKFVRDDGALDIDHIKERLMKTAAYVMKEDKENPIKDLLFQNISQQSY